MKSFYHIIMNTVLDKTSLEHREDHREDTRNVEEVSSPTMIECGGD